MGSKYTKLRKIMLISALCIATGILSGCNADLSQVRAKTDNLDNAMQEVIDRNVRVIDELEQSGLLNDQQAEVWRKSVSEKCMALMNSADKEALMSNNVSKETAQQLAESTFEQFKQAIVQIAWESKEEETNEEGEVVKEYNSYNYIVDKRKSIKNITDGQEANAQPLLLFDDASVTTFISDLNRPVYVLDIARKTNGVNDVVHLKYLQLALSILKNDKKTLEEIIARENFTDDHMVDNINTIGKLKQNMGNLSASQQKSLENYVLSFFRKTDSTLASLDVDDIFTNSIPNSSLQMGERAPANQLNYDVVISSDGLASISVRVRELNKNLLPYLQGFSGNVDSGGNGLAGEYYLMKSSKIALKLDYNLEVISDIYTGSIDKPGLTTDTDWECKTSPTNYNISVYDGSMITEDGHRNSFTQSPFTSKSVMVHPKNRVKTKIGYVQRYTTGTANEKADEVDSNEIDFTKASTKEIIGDVEYTCFYKKDGTKVYAHYNWEECPTVVLRDYLEYNYFPNVIDNENFITVGRFMRINKLSGTKDDIAGFAEAITKNGVSFENPIYISLRDIVDHQSGQGYYEGVNEKLGLGQDNSKTINDELSKGSEDRKDKLKEVINSGLLDDESSTQEKSTEMELVSKKLQLDVYFNWIRPVEVFGTKEDEENGIQAINDADSQAVKDYSAPTVWGMFTSNSISENLWGSWITPDSSKESGSLAWFSKWLKDNGFTYDITQESLLRTEENLESSYKQSGSITVDLNTAAKVQRIQDEKYGFNLERTIRTTSRIIGMLITLYSLILLGCWVIDVNIEGGPGFLKVATFGKWISIRDSSGVPPMPPDGVHYLDFKALAFNVFITMCLGIVLIVLDVIDIKNILSGYTENIINTISDMLFG